MMNERHIAGTILAAFGTVVLSTTQVAAIPPFTIEALVLEGDNIAGVGIVTRIDNIAVNNSGQWFVEADTNNADTNADSVLIRNGELFLREGQALAEPDGATLDTFDSVIMNNNGDGGWNFFLDGTSGINDDSGLYFNNSLVLQEGTISSEPRFTPGTPYIGFFDTKFNDSNLMLVTASMDDVNIPSSVDRAMMLLELDSLGNLISETAIAIEGDVIGSLPPLTDFETGPHETALNQNGDVMYVLKAGSGFSAFMINLDPVVITGEPSPVPGRNWGNTSSTSVALNNNGGYLLRGSLDGDTASNSIIVKNGAKLVQEGDSVPGIGESNFTSLGTSGPLGISDNGDVIWWGDWNDPNTDIDTGLFYNDELLIQEGVSQINGQIVDIINGSSNDGFDFSDNGLYLIIEATLADGTNGAFLITFEDQSCPADFNGDGQVNTLDFLAFLNAFSAGDPAADFNGDGVINTLDFLAFLNAFNAGCP